MRQISSTSRSIALAATLLGLPFTSWAAVSGSSAVAETQADQSTTLAAQARLHKSEFKNVRVGVESGIATLTGSVALYEFKADAQKRISHVKGIAAIRNSIEVGGPAIPDPTLQAKLAEALAYDRVGFGNAFNAITVRVQNGVVTLGGHAHTYIDRDSALALVNTTPGVMDVENQIEVDPVSIMDDQTRFAVARAIYGYAALNKYSVDPVRPIRISVQNGHVELYGVVDSQTDKEIAFMRANGVPGVFSVKNYLQVANQPTESPQ